MTQPLPSLTKARLSELDAKGKIVETTEVQLNPTSLRLQMSNNKDEGKSRERQVQQHNGQGATQLSFELVFDTADEGTDSDPVDVRTKTERVERFVVPNPKKGKKIPPRVHFQWGHLIVQGVMTSLSEEIDLFSADGAALRAKLSITISAQSPELAATKEGAGARNDQAATDAGGQSSPSGAPNNIATANAGETAADFLQRQGLDPSAWRGLRAIDPAGALDAALPSLDLPAGQSFAFSGALGANAGIGAQSGFGASTSLDAVLASGGNGGATIAADAATLALGAPGRTPAQISAAAAMTAAGGVAASVDSVAGARASDAAGQARSSFGGATGASPPTAPSAADVVSAARGAARAPLRDAPALVARGASASAPQPPMNDPRAVTYAFGVPLRPPLPGAVEQRLRAQRGPVVIGSSRTPPRAGGAPWGRLPDAPPSPGGRCGCARSCDCGKRRRP